MCNGTCQNFSTPCEGKCHQKNWTLSCNGVCESFVDRNVYQCHDRCLNIDTPCNLTCPNDRFLNCNGTCAKEGNSWLCNEKCQSLSEPCKGFCPTNLHQNKNEICQISPSQQRSISVAHCKNPKMPCYGLWVSISSTFYEQLLRQYPCAENLQSQTASTKVFRRKIIGAKAARKMLMKLTQVVSKK
jgi:hypothetical protein